MNLTPRVFWANLQVVTYGRIHVAVGPWMTACGMDVKQMGVWPRWDPATCLRCLAATGQTGELLGDEG
jgi:hypothetical protein